MGGNTHRWVSVWGGGGNFTRQVKKKKFKTISSVEAKTLTAKEDTARGTGLLTAVATVRSRTNTQGNLCVVHAKIKAMYVQGVLFEGFFFFKGPPPPGLLFCLSCFRSIHKAAPSQHNRPRVPRNAPQAGSSAVKVCIASAGERRTLDKTEV